VCDVQAAVRCEVCAVSSEPREYTVEIKKHIANVGPLDEICISTVFDLHLADKFDLVLVFPMHAKRVSDRLSSGF